MSGLVFDSIEKKFGDFTAVHETSLTIPNGKFVCLLGPSGCGKTTLLRMIAGLEDPTHGRILLEGNDVTRIPTHQRDFGMVFQNLALFPHLTVGENIAYPLRIRGGSKADCFKAVKRLLELVQLPDMADRPVAKLSGGQRQRVAIARALALEPKLFLLDEPLSALDAKLRESMQIELKQLQQKLGITTIVVTHDQREAMTMADLVVVMSQGKVHQVAPPVEIYRKPKDAFVADFIGMTNLITGRVNGTDQIAVAGGVLLADDVPASGDVTISVRPENIRLAKDDGANAPGILTGTVSYIRDLGASIEFYLDVSGQQITAITTPSDRPDVTAGDRVSVSFPREACVVLGDA
ncbi:ABC transporter ATP-binding protein [Thalassospira sp.]|uniref:ABC transporter ATP-binding protein n=1 Tax=Thalassospira sp. TaxID=1912094 RepID=UPI000C609BC1|nr:ABC transporter ATP-binding protein [Thalassospira sp.]MAL38728.1 polyamine ABC transporter ATP-binding protein [Thalassospira sp.]